MPGRKKRGKGLLSDAWNKVKEVARAVHQTAKDRKVISGALKSMGHTNLAKMIKDRGYGRKKRTSRRRGRGGIGFQLPGGFGGISVGWGRGGGVSESQKVLVM
jgi:hypothetical protein